MSRTYKTARGRSIDFTVLRLRNESEVAVGNMQVNARGDRVDGQGKVIQTRNEMAEGYYKQNIPQDPRKVARDDLVITPDVTPLDDFADANPTAEEAAIAPQPELRGGLADAMARTEELAARLAAARKADQ
jgi:hypothetical protein